MSTTDAHTPSALEPAEEHEHTQPTHSTALQGNQDRELDAITRSYIEQTNAKCPACGYALRGVQVMQCPECGLVLELGLRDTRGRVVQQRSAMSGTLMACSLVMGVVWGFTLLMLVISAFGAFIEAHPTRIRWGVTVLIALTGCVLSIYMARKLPRKLERLLAKQSPMVEVFLGTCFLLGLLAVHMLSMGITLTVVMP